MDQAQIKTTVVLGIVTLVVGLLVNHADASGCKQTAYTRDRLSNIKNNQDGLARTRPNYNAVVAIDGTKKIEGDLDAMLKDYNAFLDFKTWNESEVNLLAERGCAVDWATMELVDAKAEKQTKSAVSKPVAVKANYSVASTPAAPSGHWYWKNAPDYKNERLAYYQDKLRSLGITDSDKLKWLSAQLLQENGSFNEAGIYHGNCVFGIPQFNACGRHNMSATEWLKKHPEWKDWRFQLDQLAAEVAYRSELFNGEISCMILAHFHPNGSRGAKGLYASKGTCKSHKYYHTEVAQRLDLLVKAD